MEGLEPYYRVTKKTELLDVIYCVKAAAFWGLGRAKDAVHALNQQTAMHQHIGHQKRACSNRLMRALILRSELRFSEAEEVLSETRSLCIRNHDWLGLSQVFSSIGMIERDRGALLKSLKAFQHEERLCRHTSDQSGVQRSLGNQSLVHADLGDFDGAERLLDEKQTLCLKAINRRSTAYLHDQWAYLFQLKSNWRESQYQLRCALVIFSKLRLPAEVERIERELRESYF